MVAFIGAYVLYFSWIALIWFRGTLQGTQHFDNFMNALYNMFVLFTASNSPDVYLPSYETERSECIFFIVYMFIGIFLLRNLMLATIADTFSNSFQEQLNEFKQERNKFLKDEFDRHAGNIRETDNGHLNKETMYKYFLFLHMLISGKI